LRWNRGCCLAVARHSRGEILKIAVARPFRLRPMRELFLHALVP
jgi:hypothetical protein